MALQARAQSDTMFGGPGVGPTSTSGWDRLLSGAAKMGGNFLVGLSAGLQSYDPNNPFSSFGASLAASTRGIQQKLNIPFAETEAQFSREQKRLDELSAFETALEKQRKNIAGASVVSSGQNISGIISGITPRKFVDSDEQKFGFRLFEMPKVAPGTAAEKVRFLQGGKR